MKIFRKIFMAAALTLGTIVGIKAINKTATKVDAGVIPSGQTLDTDVDTVSIKDLNLAGKTGLSAVLTYENTDVTYNKTSALGSLVLKFKYDIAENPGTDKMNFRVHFDVADDKWNNHNSYMIRGDKVFLQKWRSDQSIFSYSEKPSLAVGLHEIEYGRVALLNEGVATGSYYCYMKVDGAVYNECVNPYDVTKMDNTMFFNIGADDVNKKNAIYDITYTYEQPQYVSIADLSRDGTKGRESIELTTDFSKTYSYDMYSAPANKSVVFVADIDYTTAGSKSQVYIFGGNNTWNQAGYSWFQSTQVYLGTTNDDDGTAKSSKGVVYKTDTDGNPIALEAGKTYRIEYGRLAIMNGDTFTGKYRVYYKIDGKIYNTVEQPIMADVANGGTIHINGSGHTYKNVITTENAKQITVSNLMNGKGSIGSSVNMASTQTYTFDNADHTANYSLVFKFKFTPTVDGKNSMFQFKSDAVDNYKYGGAFLLNNGDTCHIGKSTLTSEDSGATQINFNMAANTTYDIEYGRVARLIGGKFTGEYNVYLKVDGNLLATYVMAFPNSILTGNKVFLPTSDTKAYTMADNVTMEFETADEIYVSDLKHNGTAVGNTITLDSTDNGNHFCTYEATATHKSMIFRGELEILQANSDADSTQFYFTNAYGAPIYWVRGDKTYLMTDDSSYQSRTKLAVGDHQIELGRLYITSGVNTGKYYTYLKDGDNLVMSYITSADIGKAELYVKGSNGNTLVDTKPATIDTYETADQLSISKIRKSGGSYGQSITLTENTVYKTDSANITAAHKSVVYTFKWVVANPETVSCQFHFNDGYGNDKAGGIIWFVKDNVHLTIDGDDDTKVQYVHYGQAPFAKAGTYEVEIGKLYITGGANTGKYYVYAKVNGTLVVETVAATMPDKANLFMTGSNGDELRDINAVSYETADQISISNLAYSNDAAVGNEFALTAAKYVKYTATATNKSVVFKFKYETTDASKIACQVHFANTYIEDVNKTAGVNAGMVWIRSDKIFIQKDDGGYNNKAMTWANNTIYNFEIGKLYVTEGPNTGKYYVYCKINDTLYADAIINSMPDMANIFFTGSNGDKMYDITYIKPAFETADVVSVGDLLAYGQPVGNVINITGQHTFNYVATAEHKSVIFQFLYHSTAASDNSNCDNFPQFHFNDGFLSSTANGMVWIRADKFYIKEASANYGYISKNGNIADDGVYLIEIGKIYITAGENAGKYWIYAKNGDNLIVEDIVDTMPDKACIFQTGTCGDAIYDVDYVNVNADSGLYVYNWNANKSGILFEATLDKAIADYQEVTEVGFYIANAATPTETTKVAGKLVVNGGKYVVKAAVAALSAANITNDYVAKVYYVLPGVGEVIGDVVTTNFYKELGDLTGVSEANAAILNAIKAKVLVASIDEVDCTVVGATKVGDFETATIVLTGANASYDGFVLNGKIIKNNQIVKVGYLRYQVTLGANTITLTKQDHEIEFGGSEHFVELNPGHDDDMTAAKLAPMTSELGLGTVRLDIYLGNVLDVTATNELVVDYSYVAKVNNVIKELKTNGGVTDFLAVLWTVQPNGYPTVEGQRPWATSTAPDPVTQADLYLQWLQLNGQAAQIVAELFPDITNYEPWNEPELQEDNSKSTLCKTDGSTYTAVEKARILTDLMYYFNAGIKAANPDNVMTTPSLCCATTKSTSGKPFEVTSPDFLAKFYAAIADDTPVTGYTTVDTDPNNYFQVINIHPYIGYGTTLANWTNYVTSFYTIAANNNDAGTEVWITEFGFAQNRYDTAQADMLNVLAQAQNIEFLTRFYFYKVHDYTDKIDADRWGLYYYDGSIKAIGTAVKDVINPAAE